MSYLEPCWAILSDLGGHLGLSEALLEPSWAILGALTARGPPVQVQGEGVREGGWKEEGASLKGWWDYLVAFGPSRHRAWVVGQRPLECSLGSRGRPLGGLLEGVLKLLGGGVGASWGVFWASWGPPGGILGASWGPVGASWGPLGASERDFRGFRGPLG